jgi:hypothetical protein
MDDKKARTRMVEKVDAKVETPPAGESLFYSNIAQVMITPEELVIHFGVRKEEDPASGVGIAKVYLNHSHAKRLAGALVRVIESFEKDFGEIEADPMMRLAPEARKRLGLEKEKLSNE